MNFAHYNKKSYQVFYFMVTADELRKKYLDFFSAKGHAIIPSASLVPDETDPTALFTTAGMHPFKRYYLEPNEIEISQAVTVQKCLRTGDIEEVGDKTHLTFFEMLGNFSFSYPNKKDSYFKTEALQYAWDFLTKEIGIDKSRIYATYFQGEKEIAEDKESLKILKNIDGLKEIKPQGKEDNFWSLGTEGSPGGPTVEFYVDGIEIWNCVFNEYVLRRGHYEPLKNKGVDTGMGLERLLTVLNGLDNVYETELFAPIIIKIKNLSGCHCEEERRSNPELNNGIATLHSASFAMTDKGKGGKDNRSCRIIADHIKASVFIIADGVAPSNVGRGYVLRRLIRRAVGYGKIIGIDDNFLKQITETVINIYKKTYPEVEKNKDKIFEELEKEENKFQEELKQVRETNWEEVFALRPKENGGFYSVSEAHAMRIGRIAFDFFQTKGFPLEFILEELDKLKVDYDKNLVSNYFNKELEKHQELSRTASAGKFKGGLADGGEKVKKLHTATHLLLAALREVLGDHVYQKGSNITAERLRFDFSHPDKLTDEQKQKVEDLVNEAIKKDLPISFQEMSLDEAKKMGAMGVFEAKYGDKVKVYKIGPSTGSGQAPSTGSGQTSKSLTLEQSFSCEICGGPHVKRTGELGHFKIKKEQSSGAGVRRIKAVLK